MNLIKYWLFEAIYYIPDWIATFKACRDKEFMEAIKNPQDKDDYVELV